MRIARANARWPAVASSPVRCGSSEVWMAWNSCSGARAISSTSNTIPASALSVEVAATVSTAAFSSVCSESMMLDTQPANPVLRRSESSSWALTSWTASVPGPASPAAASSTVIGDASNVGGCCDPRCRKAIGTTTSDTNGAAAMPERDRRLAARDAERDGQREADARQRLHQDEAAIQRKVFVARQPAAREVAGRVRQRAGQQHVEQRLVVVEDVVDELFLKASAAIRKTSAKPAWIAIGTRSGCFACPRARRSAIVRESSCSVGR